MEHRLNKNKSFLVISILCGIIVLGVFFYGRIARRHKPTAAKQSEAQSRQQPADSISVAYITDIHADNAKIKKDAGNNTIYPSNYKKCLEEVLAKKTDMIIATGDNTEKGDLSYYQDLKSMTAGRNVIWAKGNHDSSDYNILAQNYYLADYQNWRFIVLDSSEQFGSSTGYLDATQISFLKNSVNTNKRVVVVMHHPPFQYDSRNNIYTRNKIPLYDDFFSALAPNVKYVLTGHWHHDIGAEIDGVKFLTEKALTQDDMCNYQILNLPNTNP